VNPFAWSSTRSTGAVQDGAYPFPGTRSRRRGPGARLASPASQYAASDECLGGVSKHFVSAVPALRGRGCAAGRGRALATSPRGGGTGGSCAVARRPWRRTSRWHQRHTGCPPGRCIRVSTVFCLQWMLGEGWGLLPRQAAGPRRRAAHAASLSSERLPRGEGVPISCRR